jgi:hypothetical protein
MKIVRYILFVFFTSAAIFAQNTEKDWSLIPLLNYEFLSFENQTIHSPGEGMMFTQGNIDAPASEEQNSLSIMAMAKQFILDESKSGYPNLYHSIIMIAEKRIQRHSILGFAISESDKPFYGGIRTLIAGAGYGYELIRKEHMSLILGLDITIMNTDIKISDDENLPVMIYPRINFDFQTSWLDFSCMFFDKLQFNATLFPQSRLRLINTFVIPMGLRDERDLIIDTMLMYRLFSEESAMGDFAGIGIGFRNNRFGFTLAEKDKSYDMLYHSVYGMIDLSFLQISGGYSFNAIESYGYDKNRKNIDDGFHLNITAAWQF